MSGCELKWELEYQIVFHIVDDGCPKYRPELAQCTDKHKLIRRYNIVYVEYHRLHQRFEVLPYESITVLHHVGRTDWWNMKPIEIRALKPDSEDILLSSGPIMVKLIPCILSIPEEDCVQYFDQSILRWVEI